MALILSYPLCNSMFLSFKNYIETQLYHIIRTIDCKQIVASTTVSKLMDGPWFCNIRCQCLLCKSMHSNSVNTNKICRLKSYASNFSTINLIVLQHPSLACCSLSYITWKTAGRTVLELTTMMKYKA